LGWRVYRASDGLAESACGSVTVVPAGKVLARHFNLSVVSELDGYDVRRLPAPDIGPTRVYGSRGGQVWAVVPTGLAEYRADEWVMHPIEEIAAEFSTRQPRYTDPLPLSVVRQSIVLVLLPGQLLLFNIENPTQPRKVTLRKSADTQLGRFLGLVLAQDDSLWVTAERGIAKIKGPSRSVNRSSEWSEYLAPAGFSARNFQQPQEDARAGLTMLADSFHGDEKVMVHFENGQWSAPAEAGMRLRAVWRGPEGQFWAMSLGSLRRQPTPQVGFAPVPDISARQYFDIAVEPGGAFWLATSDGLFRYALPAWRRPLDSGKALAHCLAADEQGGIWFISGSSLCHATNGGWAAFPLPKGVPDAQSARAFHSLANGRWLLETEEKLFVFAPEDQSYREVWSAPAHGTFRALGTLRNRSVLFHLNPVSGVAGPATFDGKQWQSWVWPGSGPEVGESVQAVYATQNGDLWVSGELALAWWHAGEWRRFSIPEKLPAAVTAFAELSDGRLCCATRDQVWEFGGRDWLLLRSGLDQVNGMIRTTDGSLWVASNSGLFRWLRGIWLEQGISEGLPDANVRDFCEDNQGRLWVGTPSGLSRFFPEADQDPPRTSIRKIPRGTSEEAGVVSIGFTGLDKWKFTPRDRLVYSFRLDDQEWSPFSELSETLYTDLSAGKHVFQARALDRCFNLEAEPARFEFMIVLPWYKETRVLLITLLGAAAALFFAGLAFNRHLRLVRSYAEVERKVAERTRELEAASRALAQSQRMNALGTLAAGVAHDFNSILSIIKGSAQIIEDNLGNETKIQTRVDRIKAVVEQGASLVKAMLGYARSDETIEIVPDLNQLVNGAAKLLGERFLSEVATTFELEPGLPPVRGSADLIQQILLNFVLNAAEAMTVQPRVLIRTARWEKPTGAELALAPVPAPAYVALIVKDWGGGILPENLPRIFEPFFTTKAFSARRGTGLGLSMVYEMAGKMGAGLAVESQVDQGSAFSLILRVSVPEFTAPIKTTPSAPELSIKTHSP